MSTIQSLLTKKAKAVVLPILSKFTRIRWDFASISESGAYQSVCSTRSEKDIDKLGQADAMRVLPFMTPTSKVLDIGCGVGRVEKFLAPHCGSIEGVDVSDRMISIAKKRLETVANVHLRRTNATDLRIFSDETFDFSFSFHCLQHMEKEDAFLCLKEIFRVLKKSGAAYLHFPDFTSETYFSLFRDEGNWNDKSRVQGYTLPELEKIVTSIGFTTKRLDKTCLNPFVLPQEHGRDILLLLEK